MFEPSGRAISADLDPADPRAAAGDRPALARRRRRGARGPAGQARRHRARRGRQAHRRARLALGTAARDLAIRLVLDRAARGATARRCATSRSTAARSTSPPAAPAACRSTLAARALPLGGQRRRERRAIEPALSCRLVGRGGELPDVPDKLTATLDKTSYQPGDTAKLFVKAPFAGEAELAIASDKVSVAALVRPCRPSGTTIDIPVDAGWGSGVYALVTAYRPPVRPSPPAGTAGSAPRARAGARGRRRLARHRSGAAHARRDAVRAGRRAPARAGSRCRSRSPGSAAGEEAYVTLAAVDEAVLKLTDFASPAPDKLFLRQAQARGRIARPLRPADRPARRRGRRAAQRRRPVRQALGRRPARQEQPGRRAVFRHRQARRRRRRDGQVRHARFPGPVAADGGGVRGAQGRLGERAR